MIAGRAALRTVPPLTSSFVLTGLAVGLVLVGLAARPVGLAGVGVTAVASLIGVTVPVPTSGAGGTNRRTWLLATALGLTAFGLARTIVPGWAVHPLPVWGAAVTVAAGVGEEALFRRLLYGWLARWGVVTAIVGSAVSFALIHIPGYGLGTFAVNLAAGVLFAWQRWASGG